MGVGECRSGGLEVHRNADACLPKLKLSDVTQHGAQQALDQADRILEACAAYGVTVLNPADQPYPRRLLTIPQRPLLLYAKGNLTALKPWRAVAFIGTRAPSDAAQVEGYALASCLTKANVTIVSGLALGCDTIGHRACLDGGGQTVAVLPGGLDHIFPKENAGLAAEILEKGGCLLSEYPVGVKPQRRYFVERDRLQSGLADAVFVLETGVKGGTMHTVGFAEKQGRVLACWHPHDGEHNVGQGNQLLLREGRAVPVGDDRELAEFVRRVG